MDPPKRLRQTSVEGQLELRALILRAAACSIRLFDAGETEQQQTLRSPRLECGGLGGSASEHLTRDAPGKKQYPSGDQQEPAEEVP